MDAQKTELERGAPDPVSGASITNPDMPIETPIQFPHYEVPHPRGIPLMDDPRQAKVLNKMLKMRLKLPKPGLRSKAGKATSVKLPKVHRYRKERDL